MAQYRKRPVVIEAQQLNEANWRELRDWVNTAGGDAALGAGDEISLVIRMEEGRMRANLDDWIIRGIKGEFYPCKPDIFLAGYERA